VRDKMKAQGFDMMPPEPSSGVAKLVRGDLALWVPIIRLRRPQPSMPVPRFRHRLQRCRERAGQAMPSASHANFSSRSGSVEHGIWARSWAAIDGVAFSLPAICA
jgi:hypothetical protein